MLMASFKPSSQIWICLKRVKQFSPYRGFSMLEYCSPKKDSPTTLLSAHHKTCSLSDAVKVVSGWCCSRFMSVSSNLHDDLKIRSTMSSQSTVEGAVDSPQSNALEIFESAVRSVCPREMIDKALRFDPNSNELEVEGQQYSLNGNLYVVGFGKAVLGMARAVEDRLGRHLVEGILSVPVGIQDCFREAGKSDLLLSPDSRLRVYEGARNNLPDLASHQAAQAIHTLVSRLTRTDLLLVLISGGGSALLPMPRPPVTLDEEMTFTRLLGAAGATINELNTIRKNIEVLKGGGLAIAAQPAKVLSLILSDVIDDPLDIISSGPTVPDSSTPAQCLGLIHKFELVDKIPTSILAILDSPRVNHSPINNSAMPQNVIVGSNRIALSAAAQTAERMGYLPCILTSSQQGIAADVGRLFAAIAKFVCLVMQSKADHNSQQLAQSELEVIKLGGDKAKVNSIIKAVKEAHAFGKGIAIIAGGESTVNVRGGGKGGRNQEMTLACALAMKSTIRDLNIDKKYNVVFLSGGTDGIDGPTDAAGAVVTPDFTDSVQSEGLDADQYLQDNNSYSLFSAVNQGSNFIRTGHTGTNVMDLHVVLVKAK